MSDVLARMNQIADQTRAENVELVKDLRSAAIENANLTVKYLFAVNGGAAVAMLGFVGAVASQGRVSSGVIKALSKPLESFATGVTVAVTVMLVAYAANGFFAAAASNELTERTMKSRIQYWTGSGCTVLGYLLATWSLFLFLGGIGKVVMAMQSFEFNNPSF